MARIEFRNVGFRYGDRWILRNLSFKFDEPGLVAIVGASGSGKTTLLKLAAGLLQPHEGEVICDAKSIGWVPQDVGLFPWMTVFENIALPMSLRRKNTPQEESQVVTGLSEALGIGDLVSRLPKDISGGEAQRAGIARALAAKSDLLLMDEPFSALDDAKIKDVTKLVWKEFVERRSGLGLISSHKDFARVLPKRIDLVNLGAEENGIVHGSSARTS